MAVDVSVVSLGDDLCTNLAVVVFGEDNVSFTTCFNRETETAFEFTPLTTLLAVPPRAAHMSLTAVDEAVYIGSSDGLIAE